VRAVADDFPTLMALVAGSKLRIELEPGAESDAVAKALPELMSRSECVTLRKTKSGENMTNIRPFVAQADIVPNKGGYTLEVLIANRAEGSLKPAVLMNALCELAGVDRATYIAYRDAILARETDGRLVPLEEYHG